VRRVDGPDRSAASRPGDPASTDATPDVDRDPGKGHLPMLIGLILVSVVLAAVAQLTLKYGMNQVRDATGVVQLSGRSLRSVASTPAVWGGLALFGLSAAMWIAVLSRASLSFAYPFVSLTYVLILVFDRFILHQPVGGLRWAGVALIAGGIALVAQTSHA
jgi:multidrug transporter EmrE-like cation transporter